MIKKIFSIALIFFISLPLISCTRDRGLAYKIVNAKGKTVKIERKVPELNAQFLPEEYVVSQSLDVRNDEIIPTPEEVDYDYEEFNFDKNLEDKSNLDKENENENENDKLKKKVIPIKKKETPKTKSESDELKLKLKTEKTTTEPVKIESTKKIPTIENPHYVQIGAYSVKNSALNLQKEFSSLDEATIKVVKINNKNIHRVLLGPVNSRTEAEVLLNKVIKKGRYDAFITQR